LHAVSNQLKNVTTTFVDRNSTIWFIDAGELKSFNGKEFKTHPIIKKNISERIWNIQETVDATLIFSTIGIVINGIFCILRIEYYVFAIG